MSDTPWLGDACGLVEAYRSGECSPAEVLEASIAAIGRSSLNAFSHLDLEAARAAAATADVDLPFGGVPIAVKELERVAGWPATEASMALAGEVAEADQTSTTRLRATGAVLVGQTTASEFGDMNYTSTPLHGTTRNPWSTAHTPGGSSGGTAAAVAGGLVPLATGSDGGGSIRIPAGFCGLFGLKPTYGRIPRGPSLGLEPHTTAFGVLTRSVRDAARYFDACNGYDPYDPYSLPKVGGWEDGLGSVDLAGRRAVVVPDLGTTVVRAEVAELVDEAGRALAAEAGLRLVDAVPSLPPLTSEWAIANKVSLMADLYDRYPDCADELTAEVRFALDRVDERFDLRRAARIERFRRSLNDAMAAIFSEVDVVICATNPDVAFAAEGPSPLAVGGVDLVPELGMTRAGMNNATLTAPSNLYGNPAMSVPAGTIDGRPVGLQVLARHHAEPLLLELALAAERSRPWPLTAPGSPH